VSFCCVCCCFYFCCIFALRRVRLLMDLPQNQCETSINRIDDAVIKMGLSEFATLLDDGSQKSQIDHYIREI
jgi:hypothetical protein